MNAESAGQDPEISQIASVRTALSQNEIDQEQSEDYNRKYTQTDQYLLEGDVCDIEVKNPPTTPHVAGRNKRKNFNPRYTSGSSMGEGNDESPVTVSHNPELRENHHHYGLASRTSESPTDCPAASVFDSGVGPALQQTDLPPWMQMLNQYDQFVKTAGLTQHPMPSVSDGGSYSMQESPALVIPEWARKFGTSELAVSAIHDLLKVYHKRGVNRTSSLQTGYDSGNLPTETEPPTPPTTPHAYHSTSRSIIPNGSGDHHETTVHRSPAKKESIDQSAPPILASAMAGLLHTNNYPTNLSNYKRVSPLNESPPPRKDPQWANQSAPAKAHNSHQTWQTKESSGDEGHSSAKTLADCVNSFNDDSSDYCDPAVNTSGGSSSHQLRQWPEYFQNIPESSFAKRIKSECDDTDTTIGDADNNQYDEDDYPASPTDYPDSTNDDDDDDGNFSVNTFCDDEISTGDDQMRTTSECDRNNTESVDVDEAHSVVAAEKDGSCSNSSSKISVRNLGAPFDQSQLNLIPSKMRGGIEEKGLHADFVQNMSKFTSYLECQNEMCRLESLREHYHCYDFPCFGKVFSKKEEVIRHVKWHRKRVESLNHGFMRFSSSDDCSTTFGSNCPHNRKQTHYHCFQPNCDRVYISTSDVQMHSNFHRKDSAIHKEGFQRFRANEKCSADYCMFSGQKTTHFHCRRDNCRFTFKNKADMEKHKTYHIKDLKLARDGFKKFLKNEQCPYKQCRFSRVCNHIHCARENCFYVLHSSGQLLSHKRKHERMDNEQTYCRYKMLAVKAALLGNAAAAAAAVTPKISPYNLTSSLLRLRDMDIGSVGLPRAASEPSLPSPQQGMYNKDSVNEPPSPTSLSTEFLQQMKKRHDELLKQKLHLSTRQVATDVSRSEVSMFPVIHPEPTSPQHQYNMGLDHNQLTPSVIQQFFTTECVTQSTDNDDPINLTNLSSTGGKAEAKPQCPWKERLEAHLHCIFKDCEAVIPNNVLDMTAHIRMHGYNRDVYATTAAACEPLLSSGSTTSNNAMQITTIDGFFNRKRGRPPKNRFVEVYKNAQQSPQAIFTSFKLEKQSVTNSTTCDTATGIPHNQPPTGSLCNDTQRSLESPLSLVQPANLVQTSMTSQFTTHKANEHCGVGGLRCSLSLQHHYHCICSADCTFVTAERDLLAVHLERLHTAASFADTISQKFKRFDRHIGLDCGILECRLRKTRPHLHCRQCYRQISPFDLETHICGNIEYRPMSLSPTKRRSEQHLQQPAEISGDNFTIHSAKHLTRDFSSLPSVTFSTINELRRKVSEMEPEASSTPKRSHEDEKVLVVRAAGTYFPENTNEMSGISPNAQQKLPSSSNATECIQLSRTISTAAYCSTPYCKMKRKPHEHCEFCDQSFVDLNKSREHRLTHIVTPTKPIPSHQQSLHSTDFGEDNKRKSYPQQQSPMESQPPALAPHMYEEQPQDLTLSPDAATISIAHDDRTPPNRETYTTPPAATQTTSAPAQFPNIFPPDFMCSLSMQNFHLAQLAALYQQNPYYYQHLYPFLSNAAAFSRQQHNRQAQSCQIPGNDDKGYFPAPADCPNPAVPPAISPLLTAVPSAASGHFPFLNPLLLTRSVETATASQKTAPGIGISPNSPMTSAAVANSLKRKQTNGSGERFSAIIDALAPSTKKRMQFAAGLAAAAAAAATTANVAASTSGNHQEQHGQHFKIKDEQIPTGYLKFRFNEDCYFPKCGYRNHQSHFHCDRNDCHYSFCDKTRFVQHTARHERLDKLMGNDFRQYRANMNCGYENCPYFKNLGSANKSSHFHCLKCDFICSDTNKVVAHRRQHSKMEYIRMAGFRKVTNSERCNSTFEATVPTNGNEIPGTVECSYSQKQTHYHCLVCDVSVLSRAQLASHKHKTS